MPRHLDWQYHRLATTFSSDLIVHSRGRKVWCFPPKPHGKVDPVQGLFGEDIVIIHQTSNQDFPINSSHPPCGSFGFYGLWKVAKKCGMGRCQTWNSPISQNGFTNFPPKNGTQQFQPKINNSNLPGKWDWSVANHLGPKPPTPSRLNE